MPPLRGQAPRQIMGTNGPSLPSCLVFIPCSSLARLGRFVQNLGTYTCDRPQVEKWPDSAYDRGLPELHSQ